MENIMSIMVTGGAGFIGSCLIRSLNDRGIRDIIVVDHIDSTQKWRNLVNKSFLTYIPKEELPDRLEKLRGEVDTVFHLGACSSTTELDFDYLWRNNVEYSQMLWNYCAENKTRLIYASSAATYGDGANGFDDSLDISLLRPLNGYGYSKQLFDLWAEKQTHTPAQHVGLKFFNVYGPNEYCKSDMASMVYHGYRQAKERGSIRLFRSYRQEYTDGGQLRDFVYVKDVCEVMLWLWEHREVNGLFNVGTGRACSFSGLAEAVFHALDRAAEVEYIEMPDTLRDRYQYYTMAEMEKLREKGYDGRFRDLEEGVRDYVQNYLERGFAVY